MNDETHVGLVDAHAKSDGRHNSLELPVGPHVVYLAPSGPLWTNIFGLLYMVKDGLWSVARCERRG